MSHCTYSARKLHFKILTCVIMDIYKSAETNFTFNNHVLHTKSFPSYRPISTAWRLWSTYIFPNHISQHIFSAQFPQFTSPNPSPRVRYGCITVPRRDATKLTTKYIHLIINTLQLIIFSHLPGAPLHVHDDKYVRRRRPIWYICGTVRIYIRIYVIEHHHTTYKMYVIMPST